MIGLVLTWGFVVNWVLLQTISPAWLAALNPFLFLAGYFACCLTGVYLFNTSDNALISFLGYNLVVVPFGLVVTLVVSRSDPTVVVEAVEITAVVTALMMFAGTVAPDFFKAIFAWLTLALLLVLAVEFVQVFVLGVHSDWIDWVVAGTFCGYIGYDWGRANGIPKTLDNAVDSAAAIYMDVINLFLRVLRIRRR
jgi:FtsH-binding integral membrane protein